MHGYEEWGPELWERLRGMFAVAVWDARARRLVLARDRFGIKPLVLPRRRRRAVVRVGARRAAARARSTSTRSRRSSRSTRSRRRSRSSATSASCRPGHTLTWHDGRVDARALRAARARCRRATTRTRPSSSRSAARACATRCARTSSPTCRSACCSRAASTRARSPRSPPRSRRSRCARSRSASRRRRSTSSPARAPSRSATGRVHRELVAAARRGAAPAGARGRVRRAVRRLVGAADLPRLEARGRGRQGRALGRGRRRALRRLLHLRRRPARRARRPARRARAAARRAAADLDAPRELRLQGEAVRARRAPAAARAPPRLEGDLLRRRARGADRPRERLRPARTYRERFAETEGHELADPAAGRRLRPLPRRRPADEDRPRVDGVVARGARAVHGHGRRELRVLAARCGTRCAASRRSGCCARRSSRCCRDEVVHGRKRGFSIPAAAWLRGELRAVRARDARARTTLRRQGFLQPEAVTRVLDDHVAGREDLSRQLWGLLAFTLWYERHVEGVRRDASLESGRRHEGLDRHDGERRTRSSSGRSSSCCEAQGHEVEITARDYAQTLQLIESHGMTATVIGHHGGRSSARQGAPAALAAARRCGAGRRAATSTSRSRTARTS